MIIIVLIIVGGLIWSVSSSNKDVNPPLSANPGAAGLSVRTSDDVIRSDLDTVDSKLSALDAEASNMDAAMSADLSVATTTAGARLTASGIQMRIDSLSSLTETERSVLSANLKSDADMRLLGPEIAILATIEKAGDAVSSMQGLISELRDRAGVSAMPTASTSIASGSGSDIQTYLSDMDTKLARAKMQMAAAQNLALALKPDQGNKTLQQTNLATLKEARAKVKEAIKDIAEARKDAAIAVSLLGAAGSGAAASSTLEGRVRSY